MASGYRTPVPAIHLSWPFIPQSKGLVFNDGRSMNSGLQIHSKTLLRAMVSP